MIDITSAKVAAPASLFLALSPGLLLTVTGKGVKLANGKTSASAIFIHALVFMIVYSLIAKALKLVLTRTDLIVTAALFVLLSPGLLLTLPSGAGGVFRSMETSAQSALVHAVVYAVVFASLRRLFPSYY